MLYLESVFIGALRIIGFCIIIFVIKTIVSAKKQSQFGFDYLIPRLVTFLSVIIITGFLLTQLNAYDSFVLLTIIWVFMLLIFLNLNKKSPLKTQLKIIKTRSLIYIVKTIENRQPLINFKKIKKKRAALQTFKTSKKPKQKLSITHIYWQMGIGFLMAILGFFSRLYFYRFDRYALSDIWYKDLSRMKDLSDQVWFFHSGSMTGEFLLINLYGTLTGLSDSIALESFGLIEVAILALVIFWFCYRSFNRSFFPALSSSLFFIFFYMFLPINIDLSTMHKSVFLALIIGLPAILFIHSPKILKGKISTYFRWMIYIFTATFLINLFVAIYVLFPIVLLSFLLRYKDVYIRKSFYAYSISTVFIFLMHYVASLVLGQDFLNFIASNIYAYNTYTYTPQLAVPINELLLVYGYLACSLTALVLPFAVKNIKKWSFILVLLIQLDLLLLAAIYKVDFIDLDLLNQALTVFIPVMVGISLYLLGMFTKTIIKPKREFIAVKLLLSLSISGLVLFYLYDDTIAKIPFRKEVKNEQVLAAYDKIENDLLPYSYGVVNDEQTKVISMGNHFFLPYNYFFSEYLNQDLEYFKNKENLIYLRNNPGIIPPKSILVFDYKDRENSIQIEKALQTLKQRGRNIRIFYKNSLVSVYEIINEPKQSHVRELLF